MPLPIIFAGLSTATGADLDSDFAALGALTPLPCTISGTNTLTLALLANTPTVSSYTNYQPFTGVAVATNTGLTTVAVGSLAALEVFKMTESGPTILTGAEIAIGNLIMLIYDSALGSGVGGFHLINQVIPTFIFQTSGNTTVTASSGVTLTAASLTGGGRPIGIITRLGSPGSGFNDTTDSAANIVTSLSGSPGGGLVGTTFQTVIYNNSGQTETLVGGANVTILGSATTVSGASHTFLGQVTFAGITYYG